MAGALAQLPRVDRFARELVGQLIEFYLFGYRGDVMNCAGEKSSTLLDTPSRLPSRSQTFQSHKHDGTATLLSHLMKLVLVAQPAVSNKHQ